ncbi:MAG: hypothetical protein E7508_10275 [Ruminococcus sp.]|nr:hypothetical protein [Ruminococcus sp.]
MNLEIIKEKSIALGNAFSLSKKSLEKEFFKFESFGQAFSALHPLGKRLAGSRGSATRRHPQMAKYLASAAHLRGVN